MQLNGHFGMSLPNMQLMQNKRPALGCTVNFSSKFPMMRESGWKGKRMSLRLIPVTLAEANQFVGEKHRHSDPTIGNRFSLGVELEGKLVGVAIVENPKARMSNRREMAEVTRVCTDGTKNACSILYAACARAALAMGYTRIKTFLLATEPGTSVEAAGWKYDGEVEAQQWDRPSRGRKRKAIGTIRKKRYVKELRTRPTPARDRRGDGR
jgi:hypothetical protein